MINQGGQLDQSPPLPARFLPSLATALTGNGSAANQIVVGMVPGVVQSISQRLGSEQAVKTPKVRKRPAPRREGGRCRWFGDPDLLRGLRSWTVSFIKMVAEARGTNLYTFLKKILDASWWILEGPGGPEPYISAVWKLPWTSSLLVFTDTCSSAETQETTTSTNHVSDSTSALQFSCSSIPFRKAKNQVK